MEDHRLGAARVDGGEPGERIVAGAGHALARLLVGFADVDQNGALVDEALGAGGIDGGQRHDRFLSPAPGQSRQ